MTIKLRDKLPDLASELSHLLTEAAEHILAASVGKLVMIDRCHCGASFCAGVYTKPVPLRAYADGHRNVQLFPSSGMIILDVVDEQISFIEVLGREDVRAVIE